MGLEQTIRDIFEQSHSVYGTRKIKQALTQQNVQVSRRKIGQIMQKHQLVSVYTKANYKPHTNSCNNANLPNLLDRSFIRKQRLDVVVSDLTYVRVSDTWQYICLMIDLWNREIIGWSVGEHKDANLVRNAFYQIPHRLNDINIFHTDRGNEFDNQLIDEVLEAFEIKRSLSHKGCPYDNAVAESTNHILKTEFIYQYRFQTLTELREKLAEYIDWYNHARLHSTLNYLSPVAYRKLATNRALR